MKKVLFIHHGGIAGGAPLSMLYTMKGIRDKGDYQPVVALMHPSEKLHALYNNNGFATIETTWIPKFMTWAGSEGKRYNPVVWKELFVSWTKWKNAKIKLLDLIDELQIDMVHLNSVCLSNPAEILNEKKIPFIWHVREAGPNHKGSRYKFIQDNLLATEKVIFLSKAEQKSWTGANEHGTVVHNFIDFDQFDSEIDVTSTIQDLEIDVNKKVLLYVGGMKDFKGIIPLIKSLKLVKEKWGEDFICLMPDTFVENITTASRFEKQVVSLIEKNGLKNNCRLMAFNPNIVPLFAICDILIFPATQGHFARPIIEASGMRKPVIASDLNCIDELVIPNETGYLIPPNDEVALANKIEYLFKHPEVCKQFGESGHHFAKENFEFNSQMDKILAIYQQGEVHA